ncbi:hypothetical protein HU200_049440 [Digitaria exilis]|uniref:[RNA-polymerase]-subunit kinase n=1 Tax=Digitaria exilis TaxID=1010633 RepID=A0A835E8N2_9POAL|nr:hypothetical protein HU200_049440 [Digitaria exilis]CAB3499420.1 unnamed protein product [Digitaria exilis]
MAAATRKRPAPPLGTTTSCCPAPAAKKRVRHKIWSIYNYEKLEVLGEGTYGVVVKGRDRRTGETVAIKWIRPDANGVTDITAVLREAGCLEACRGPPSVVQMKEVVADEVTRHVFIVMEFVGPSLQTRLTRGALSAAETRAMMRQLLRGAEKLHGEGIVHRDMKPDNILIGSGGGAVKICDLGMAVPARPAGGEPYPEEVVAALWYRAPELLGGGRRYGAAVDMWALGCVMAELLLGEPLFRDAGTEEDILHMARDVEFAMESTPEVAFGGLPDLTEAGLEVLRGLLSVKPEKRLTAAEALGHRWFDEEDDEPLSSSALCSQPPERRVCIRFIV